MATKYVDPTATYDGDGTLSTPASGAGQPGAWNNLVGVLTNNSTYPVADGDTVIVRTADASGNPITVNVTSTLTMATRGSISNPVFWEFDSGFVWPFGGVITLSIANTIVFTFSDFNMFLAKDNIRRIRLLHNQSSNAHIVGVRFSNALYTGVIVETANPSPSYYFQIGCTNSPGGTLNIQNALLKISRTNGTVILDISSINPFKLEMFDVDWDLTDMPNSLYGLIGVSSYIGETNVRGGRVIGGSETTCLFYNSLTAAGFANKVSADNVDFGNIQPDVYFASALTDSGTFRRTYKFTNINNDKFAFRNKTFCGDIMWMPNQNYPVLSAILPDADNTPWSIRVQPRTSIVSLYEPLIVSNISKYYDISPGVKTLTIEMLLCDSFPTMRKRDWWAEITYVDNATGKTVSISTFDINGDLDTSTAEWSATVYGAKNYVKRKMSVETPTAIKSGSDITVAVKSALPAPGLTDFYFICPDFGVA